MFYAMEYLSQIILWGIRRLTKLLMIYGYNIYQILRYIYRDQEAARSVVIVVHPFLLEGPTVPG